MKVHRTFRKLRRFPRFRRPAPPGATPGTVLPHPGAAPTTIRVMAYGPGGVLEREIADPAELAALPAGHAVIWVDVAGLADAARLQEIGRIYGIHSLALEDIVNSHQRPKVEEYDTHDFVVARMAPLPDEEETDQLGLVLGEGFVVTFQERPGDCFDPVRDRIRHGRGRIRELGADYLAYTLLDVTIDAYFPLMESYGDRLEELEDETILSPTPALVTRLYEIRRRLTGMRRAVWPLRETAGALLRDTSPRIRHETRVYLRDCYDHTVQIIDLLEVYREMASGLTDVYLTSVSNRMNEIMKVLTIISTVFIPLTFLAGVYGMNFNTAKSPLNMPELEWYWGYPAVMAFMALIALGELWLFWRWGWLRRTPRIRIEPASQPAGPPSSR